MSIHQKPTHPRGVLDFAKKAGAKMVDAKFVYAFGAWQHFSCPISELSGEVLADGFGFDGYSTPKNSFTTATFDS